MHTYEGFDWQTDRTAPGVFCLGNACHRLGFSIALYRQCGRRRGVLCHPFCSRECAGRGQTVPCLSAVRTRLRITHHFEHVLKRGYPLRFYFYFLGALIERALLFSACLVVLPARSISGQSSCSLGRVALRRKILRNSLRSASSSRILSTTSFKWLTANCFT